MSNSEIVCLDETECAIDYFDKVVCATPSIYGTAYTVDFTIVV